ncbi:MAG: hypothetical protein ABF760_02725 [Zymomonas mobilis]|uniref:Uncharacterized protein n=1 Tax=Zymomonas mobilis TaxID=542 RepID=A0A542W054_ZYMMB|nr:hypothetical protein [Zymomonas mobilis]TQL16959.1 hypothetical protein FBY58_0512 [Zymomonas mobilis]
MQNGQVSLLGMVGDNAILKSMLRSIFFFAISAFICSATSAADFSIKQQGTSIRPGYFRLIAASPSYLITNCLISLGWEAATDEMKDENVWQIAVSYAQHPKFINLENKATKNLENLSKNNTTWQSDMTWLFIAPHPTDNSAKNYSISGYKIWRINIDQQISEKMAQAFCASLQHHSKTPIKPTQDQQ